MKKEKGERKKGAKHREVPVTLLFPFAFFLFPFLF
jgi:hypothetical protein